MDRSRVSSRGNLSGIDFENIKQDSEPNSNRMISRSKSPLRNYRESITSSMPSSIASYSQVDSYSFSKSQTLLPNSLKLRHANISDTTNKPPSKQGDVLRKFEGFKRTGSLHTTPNTVDIPKEGVYNFIQPQSLQTICNGNSLTNPMTQSYDKGDKNVNSANTFMSGVTSGGASTASYCKNCKRLEDNDKILTYSMNQLMNQFNDLIDKERLWRQGNISFEGDNFNWTNDDDQSIDSRLLKKTDSGRLFNETRKQFYQTRKIFEELILDVESLSKTNLYKNMTLQKENRSPSSSDLSGLAANPGRKLLSSLTEAKQYLEGLKLVVQSEEVPMSIKEDLKSKNKQLGEDKSIIKNLLLQLEQSKRERRALEIELTLQQRHVGGLQNSNMSQQSIRQMIRQVIDEELKANHADSKV